MKYWVESGTEEFNLICDELSSTDSLRHITIGKLKSILPAYLFVSYSWKTFKKFLRWFFNIFFKENKGKVHFENN